MAGIGESQRAEAATSASAATRARRPVLGRRQGFRAQPGEVRQAVRRDPPMARVLDVLVRGDKVGVGVVALPEGRREEAVLLLEPRNDQLHHAGGRGEEDQVGEPRAVHPHHDQPAGHEAKGGPEVDPLEVHHVDDGGGHAAHDGIPNIALVDELSPPAPDNQQHPARPRDGGGGGAREHALSDEAREADPREVDGHRALIRVEAHVPATWGGPHQQLGKAGGVRAGREHSHAAAAERADDSPVELGHVCGRRQVLLVLDVVTVGISPSPGHEDAIGDLKCSQSGEHAPKHHNEMVERVRAVQKSEHGGSVYDARTGLIRCSGPGKQTYRVFFMVQNSISAVPYGI